jgi:hypothetical protein
VERQWTTYTHDEHTFLQAIDGLFIDARRVIREEGEQGVYTMFRLRRPAWADVVQQFSMSGGAAKVMRLAREWADRYRIAQQDYAQCPVRAESWPRQRLAAAIDAMAIAEPRIKATGSPVVALPPRREDGPLVMCQFGTRYGMIDGRHRAHLWTQRDGVYPVLVLECSSS